MPSDFEDHVEVVIGGQVHSAWQHYEIESDLMTPADAWSVALSLPEMTLPEAVRQATSVQIRVGGDLVMTGTVDSRTHAVRKGLHNLDLSGRDSAAVLLDCSAAIFAAQEMTLEQVITKIVKPLGVRSFRIDADASMTREKVAIEPGETAWEALQRAAEGNGLWPWMEPDGTLVVGGPDYSVPPVASLVMRRDGIGNNILDVAEKDAPHERFSDVTVLTQSYANTSSAGRRSVKATVKDTGVSTYRPKVVVDHEASTEAIAAARARKVISDARVRGYELGVMVKGHRTSEGKLWTPGQRVHVQVEPLGIDGIYFVMSRRFSGLPQTTSLSLREDGAWVLQAHPRTLRRHGKKKAQPGKIIDVTGGGQ